MELDNTLDQVIEELKNRLETQAEECDKALNEGYEEAYRMLLKEREFATNCYENIEIYKAIAKLSEVAMLPVCSSYYTTIMKIINELNKKVIKIEDAKFLKQMARSAILTKKYIKEEIDASGIPDEVKESMAMPGGTLTASELRVAKEEAYRKEVAWFEGYDERYIGNGDGDWSGK